LKEKPLDGAGLDATGLSASRSGVGCGVRVENICVNEPGPALFGGSVAGKAAGEGNGAPGPAIGAEAGAANGAKAGAEGGATDVPPESSP
jgi:hypothetical protein